MNGDIRLDQGNPANNAAYQVVRACQPLEAFTLLNGLSRLKQRQFQ
jgi:hypothetical protein